MIRSGLLVAADDPHLASEVGGKASALHALAAAGFAVPPFVVMVQEVSEGAVPSDVMADAIRARLGDGPYAVRSSAVDEDGRDSHAGQYLSVLHVAAEGVGEAVDRVRASGARESVGLYRDARGASRENAVPRVIVQRMVAARVAGVAFSADPSSGRRDLVVVSAVEGYGDALASGEADGCTYLLRKDTGRDAPSASGAAGVLTSADLSALHALVVAVESWAGRPQDIEWAFEDDRLLLLQARPITTALRSEAVPDPHPVVLDNSNVVESYPGLVCTLTFSFARYAYARVYPAFVRLLGVGEAVAARERPTFENMLCRVDGRVYYNLCNWYRALAMLPGYRLNRSFMEAMMGVDEPLPPDVADALAPPSAQGLARAFEYARLARTAAGLAYAALLLGRTKRAFDERVERALASTRPVPVASMSGTDLARLYRRVEADLLDRWDAPLVNDFLCMVAFGVSRKALDRWAGPGAASLHNEFMIGQGGIVSAEPARLIAGMGRMAEDDDDLVARLAAGDGSTLGSRPPLAAAIDAYVSRFGDRCAQELKLESPTLHDDRSPLYRAVAGAARTTRPTRDAGDVGASVRVAMRGKPFRRALTMACLRYARARVRDRENLRFQRTRVFGLARRVLVGLGARFHEHGLLDDPRDVFHLTIEEVLGAVEGFGADADLAALAAHRKAALAASARVPDPAPRLSGTGMAATVAPATTAGLDVAPAGGARNGTGCCGGVVVAQARVVTDPNAQSLRPGEALVARHTDPGWIALFANASAIVVERGSLLSHSAIVARELGIPCVVGIRDATSWIPDGARVSVNGTTGLVEVVGG